MVQQLLYLLIHIFEAFIVYIYYSDGFNKKCKPHATLSISLSLYIGSFFINFVFNNNFILNAVVFLIINFLFGIIAFDMKLQDALLHSSILTGVQLSTELIIESVATILFDIPIDAYKRNAYALFIIGVVSKMLYLIVCKIISSLFANKKNNNTIALKKTFPLFLYPIMSVVMLAAFLYVSYNYEFSEKLYFAFLIISIISLALCCFIFIYNQSVQNQENELRALQAAKQKEDINRTFYEMLEKKNDEQRIFVHDIKHHFAAINSMDDIDKVKNYLSNIQPQLDTYQFIGKTQNKMFDLVLSKYAHICNSNSIRFDVDVRASNLNFINDDDLVSLLSNALDNAVEAVKKSHNPYIDLKTNNEVNFVVLNVINSCDIKPKKDGERLVTTKSNSGFHGYGMKSIQKTSKKYDGECQWYYDEKKKEFHLNIIFNKSKSII